MMPWCYEMEHLCVSFRNIYCKCCESLASARMPRSLPHYGGVPLSLALRVKDATRLGAGSFTTVSWIEVNTDQDVGIIASL